MSNEWTTWTSLEKPGETDSFIALALGKHHDGRLALFGGGSDQELFHRAETADGSWSEWERIGDDTVHVNFHDLAVGTHADGRLAVFTLDAASESSPTELRHLAQTAPNGGWGKWENLGAPQAQGGFFLHRNTRRRVVVGENADGRLEVFVLHRGNVNSLSPVADVWQVWQTAPNGNWSHWGKLGAIPKRSPAPPFNLEVSSNQDGRQELFLVGEGVGLWHTWQTSPNNGWSCWRDEEHFSWDSIAVGRNPDGRLEVFLTDGTGSASHTVQTVANGGWSDWLDLGNPEGVRLTTLAVESRGGGRLALFAKDDSDAGSFWHIEQTGP
ncbi:MAG: hypothetical protein L0387_46005, partial [Acidobacteria bacterium]|nr:hypothetical protein [Acidobacteriota bacterium]